MTSMKKTQKSVHKSLAVSTIRKARSGRRLRTIRRLSAFDKRGRVRSSYLDRLFEEARQQRAQQRAASDDE